MLGLIVFLAFFLNTQIEHKICSKFPQYVNFNLELFKVFYKNYFILFFSVFNNGKPQKLNNHTIYNNVK